MSAAPELWCLHAIGPDDVHAAPSKEAAEAVRDWYAERFKDYPEVSFEVKPWPYSTKGHAKDLLRWESEVMPTNVDSA